MRRALARRARALLPSAAAAVFVSTIAAPPLFADASAASVSSTVSLQPSGFAIVAMDSVTGEWGAAAVSRWIAVGARSMGAKAGVGAWASLGSPEPRLGEQALDRLAHGQGATSALDSLLARDPGKTERQMMLVDGSGRVAFHSGSRTVRWAGERGGSRFGCQGLGLRGGEAIVAMARAFETARGPLVERLLTALEAAEAVALLRGATESAAILVVREGGGPGGSGDRLTDLRVDSSQDALPELRRIYADHAATFLPAAYARFGDDAARRGDTIGAAREYERAEMGFRAAVARSPKDPDALNELAWFLAVHDRDLADALRFAKAAVTARGDDPNLYDTLAEAEYRSGSLNRAIEAMEKAVKYSVGDARYVERLRRWERERTALEQAPSATETPKRSPSPLSR